MTSLWLQFRTLGNTMVNAWQNTIKAKQAQIATTCKNFELDDMAITNSTAFAQNTNEQMESYCMRSSMYILDKCKYRTHINMSYAI